MHDETLSIHAGIKPTQQPRQSSTDLQNVAFEFDDAAHGAALFNLGPSIYTRIMNPICDVLEQRVAALKAALPHLPSHLEWQQSLALQTLAVGPTL